MNLSGAVEEKEKQKENAWVGGAAKKLTRK